MRKLLALAIAIALASCQHHAAATASAPPRLAAAAPAPAPAPATAGTHLAAVELSQTWSECSNAGGAHAAFAIDGQRMHVLRMAHAGGHAQYHDFGGHSVTAPGAHPASGWYVAELILIDRPDEDHDGNPDSSRAGWCLEGMPRYVAEVVRLWPAADEAEAHRLAATRPSTPPAYTSPRAARP